MIHKCLSNGCTFDEGALNLLGHDTGTIFVVCPVCGQDMDGQDEQIIAQPVKETVTEPVNDHEKN